MTKALCVRRDTELCKALSFLRWSAATVTNVQFLTQAVLNAKSCTKSYTKLSILSENIAY